jgi:DNA-binding NarL/FixJ family response regulator
VSTTPVAKKALRVLVCEDLPIWATYFPPDGYEDEHGRISFVLCRTMSELVDSAGDGFDVVLIDNHIPRASGSAADFNGIRAVAEITQRYGRGAPPFRIFWTHQPDPNWIYAFMAYGGHHFLDKSGQTEGAGELYGLIRAVVAGAKWEETPRALREKSDENRIKRWRRLLALLEAGFRAEDIAKELKRKPPVITTTIGEIAHSLGIERKDGAFTTLVPQAAKHFGYCWVPYRYWSFAPDKELWPDELPPIYQGER